MTKNGVRAGKNEERDDVLSLSPEPPVHLIRLAGLERMARRFIYPVTENTDTVITNTAAQGFLLNQHRLPSVPKWKLLRVYQPDHLDGGLSERKRPVSFFIPAGARIVFR